MLGNEHSGVAKVRMEPEPGENDELRRASWETT